MYHIPKYPLKLVLGESKLVLQSTWIRVRTIRFLGWCLYLSLLHISIQNYHSVLHPPHTNYPLHTPLLYRLHGGCWRWMKSKKCHCMDVAGDEWNPGICTRRRKWRWQKRSFDKQRQMGSHVYHLRSLIYPAKKLSFLSIARERFMFFTYSITPKYHTSSIFDMLKNCRSKFDEFKSN